MVRALAAVFLVASATVSTVALVAARPAVAKDGVEFDRTQARVGDRIVLASSWTSHPNGLVAYFMPLSVSARWWHIGYTVGIWCKPCNEHWTTALPNWQPVPAGMLRVLR